MPLALSTSWNAACHRQASRLLFEISSLGFKEIELSFNLSAFMVKAIAKGLKKSGLRIVSIHNFCPIPEHLPRRLALPDYYSLASCDEEERQLAIKYSKRSIETAARLGAKVVVLHCGRVEIADKTKSLIKLYEQGSSSSRKFCQLKKVSLLERNRFWRPHLENALKSLGELEKSAQRRGIRLGLETRFYHREIPSLEELGIIFHKFKGSCISYWHDTGHAEVLEKLGFACHQEYLDLYQGRLIGVHLHNILGCHDHRPLTQGEFDFKRLKPYLKKDTLKVIEVHQPATGQQIREGKQFLEEILE